MGIINVLDRQTANLIAAGEVVERPSSAIKEMLENCADAGATNVTVEIKNGGTTFIRVTDNGCGMSREDVPKCIMRHATSKIKTGSDLEAIGTFGFRGEALAAIASVSIIRIITKAKEDSEGTIFESRFGDQTLLEDAGCPDGTTITVENIFENVPARRKFLKKDSTEALSVCAVCEKFALSRSEIAVTLISDNQIKLQTPGDGNLKSAVYSCLGREFAQGSIPLEYEYGRIHIHGYITKPEFSRPNRNMQNFFVNNRYIRSRTMMAALEEGFRGFCPTGKFPSCVLFCDIDLTSVDINVHPAKLEIKFSDEKKVFDAIYFGVRNALTRAVKFEGFTESEEVFPNPVISQNFTHSVAEQKQETAPVTETGIPIKVPTEEKKKDVQQTLPINTVQTNPNGETAKNQFIESEPKVQKEVKVFDFLSDDFAINQDVKQTAEIRPVQELKSQQVTNTEIKITESFDTDVSINQDNPNISSSDVPVINSEKIQQIEIPTQETIAIKENHVKPIYIGEAFDTYIVVQFKQSLYLIDKHAAHERIIYERLKQPEHENSAQYLLDPITAVVTAKEAEAAAENKAYFEKIGFDFDEFGVNTFLIRSIPTPIAESDAKDVFTFLAGKLAEGNNRSAGEIFDRALFTAACRAAIKAGDRNTDLDNKYITEEIFNNDAVLYCPHGRPVIYEFTKNKLDKMFDRA